MATNRKRFMVLGIGVLGDSLARTLALEGADVIAVDASEAVIESIKDAVHVAAIADVKDLRALDQLGASTCDVAVVCVGEDLEAGVVATANLLELNVKHIAARANSKVAETILRRLGAHEVFYVEPTVGQVMARRLFKSVSFRELDLGGGFGVVQWDPPSSFRHKKLRELELPKRWGVQVIGMRHRESLESPLILPSADGRIEDGHLVLLAGRHSDIERLLRT